MGMEHSSQFRDEIRALIKDMKANGLLVGDVKLWSSGPHSDAARYALLFEGDASDYFSLNSDFTSTSEKYREKARQVGQRAGLTMRDLNPHALGFFR